MKKRKFWEVKTLGEMTRAEWDAICAGCGRCCVLKYEDTETREVSYTKWACRFLNLKTCRCTCFRTRKKRMPECVDLYKCAPAIMKWLPSSCPYSLLAKGYDLPDWHPLLTGDPGSTCKAGMSVRGHVMHEPDYVDMSNTPKR